MVQVNNGVDKPGKSKKTPKSDELRSVVLKFPESYMPILEELAIAFFKTGVIKKPLVSTMLLWNTDRLVTDVLAKKRAQLVKDLQSEIQRKAKEEYETKMRLYGADPTFKFTLDQQTPNRVI